MRVFEIFLCLVIYGVITPQARTLWLAQQQQAQTSYEPAARTVVAEQRAGRLVASSYIDAESITDRIGCQAPELIFIENRR